VIGWSLAEMMAMEWADFLAEFDMAFLLSKDR
jgi:hypothetical protein